MEELIILLIAFNRPSLLEQQLNLMSQLRSENILYFLSVDGPREGFEDDKEKIQEIKEMVNNLKDNLTLMYRFEKVNRGCDSHIPRSIDWAFSRSNAKAIIVLEDDAVLSESSIRALINRLRYQNLEKMLEPVVSMSGLAITSKYCAKNGWRYSRYFSAWGYGITYEFWRRYRKFESRVEYASNPKLSKPNLLLKLSRRKRRIWLERINRGNYDYQIQKFLFFNNIGTTAPLFRIADNVGHGDKTSTHTRFTMPRYLRKPVREVNFEFQNRFFRSPILTWIDSNSWAGDGFFSIRGRSTGIRTTLKNVKKSLGVGLKRSGESK